MDRFEYHRIVYSHEEFELTLHLPENPENGEFSFFVDFEDSLGNRYSQEIMVIKKKDTKRFHFYYGETKQPVLITQKR